MPWKEFERCSIGEGFVVKRSMEEAKENWWFTGLFLGRLDSFPAAIIFGSGKSKPRFQSVYQSSKHLLKRS